MNDCKLAWRLLRRDWRGGELTILFVALVVAVVSTTAIVLAVGRLQRTMTLQAADFLAADLVVSGHHPLPRQWLERGRALGLRTAETVEFATVLMENGRMLLVGVKAVSGDYPLRGRLKVTATDPTAEVAVRRPPATGTVWVVQRVLGELSLRLGQKLHVGRAALTLDRLLTFEPDVRGGFYRFAPRVLMRLEDLPATDILGPGSRVHYYYLFAGKAQEVKRLRRWLRSRLQPGQRLLDVYQDRPDIGRALRRAERYLGLSSIVVVSIAGVAVAMAARRYTERHFDAVALLKCLGVSQRRVLCLFAFQFLFLGMGASVVGTALGWGVQETLVALLRDLLPPQLVSPPPGALVFGPVVCLILLTGFALAPLLRLRRVPPARVLRRDFLPAPPSAWLVYGLALAAVAALLWRFSGDWRLTGVVLGLGGAASIALILLIWLLLSFLQRLSGRMTLVWRLGLWGLTRQRRAALVQILAFCVTLAAMTLTYLVRSDLIETWRAQLPAEAPNYFAINIFPQEVAAFRRYLTRVMGARSSDFYPIVRGRLVRVNGEPVYRRVRPGSIGEAAVNRELNLTWSVTLPTANRLVQGHWWRDEGGVRVSVESELAASLGIGVGDRLEFLIEGRRVRARVGSLRSVRWDSMTPNFYVIFSPGALQGFATTYMTSFYLPAERKAALGELVRLFPNVTLVDVDMILRHLRDLLHQVGFAVEYVLSFALLAGMAVLFAAVRSSIDDRIRQGALMRTLGARRRLLLRSQGIEFVCLGLFSGLMAVVVSELLAWLLYRYLFVIDFQPHFAVWVLVPLLGAVLTGFAGMVSCRNVLQRSPVTVLRQL